VPLYKSSINLLAPDTQTSATTKKKTVPDIVS